MRCKPIQISGWLVAAALLLSSLGGCDESESFDRVVVYGQVTYLGKPVTSGQIQFVPLGETEGPMAAAEIVDGSYRVEQRGGVPAGQHRVRIFGTTGAAPAQPEDAVATPDDGPEELDREALPPQFNTESQMETTVEAGTYEVQQDFRLPDDAL